MLEKLRFNGVLPRVIISTWIVITLAFAPRFGMASQNSNCDRRCLENILATSPNDADVLLQYGILLGISGDYSTALRAIDQGLTVAPDYIDLHIARARVLGYAARFDESLKEIDAVIKSAPQHVEAHVTRGLLLYYAGDKDGAKASFNTALTLDPLNASAREGLTNVLSAVRTSEGKGTWRLDLGYAQSNLSRSAIRSWYEKTVRLEHKLENASFWNLQIHEARRSSQVDREYQLGARAEFTPTMEGYFNIGSTPGANFLPKFHVRTGGSWRVSDGHPEGLFGVTAFNIDTRVRHYAATSNIELNPGVTQYVLGGNGWLNAVWLNSRDTATDMRLSGWLARTDFQYNDRLRVFVGYADSPEVDNNVKIGVNSRFLGVTIQLMTNLDATIAFSQERRKHSYRRNEAAASFGFRF